MTEPTRAGDSPLVQTRGEQALAWWNSLNADQQAKVKAETDEYADGGQLAQVIAADSQEAAEARRLAELEQTWAQVAPSRKDLAAARLDGIRLPAARQKAREYLADVLAGHEGGLLVTGDVGAGKTYMALAVLRGALEAGATVGFVPVGRLLRQLRASFSAALDGYIAPRLLTLEFDERTDTNVWQATEVFDLLNERWMAGRPTIVTSNLPTLAVRDQDGRVLEPGLDTLLSKATYDRLRDQSEGFNFQEASQRAPRRRLRST